MMKHMIPGGTHQLGYVLVACVHGVMLNNLGHLVDEVFVLDDREAIFAGSLHWEHKWQPP